MTAPIAPEVPDAAAQCFDAPPDGVPKLALTLRQAAMAIGLSERTLWSLANSKQVPCVHIGRRLLFPVHELQEWLTSMVKAGRR